MVLIRGPSGGSELPDHERLPGNAQQAETYPVATTPRPIVSGEALLPPTRRRWWILLVVAVAVLVVAVPLVIYAMVGGDEESPAPPAAQPAPTTPAAEQPPAPIPPPPAASPTGGIPRADLLNGRFDVPAWPSEPYSTIPVKQVKFTNGRSTAPKSGWYPGGRFEIGQIGYVDVNADQRLETLALITLTVGNGNLVQVAAFTRSASGAIVPFGQVVATRSGASRWQIGDITGFRPAGNGRVEARVGDDTLCCGVEPEMILYQWRTYGWTGSAFTQVAGPTEFGRDLRFPDLVVRADPLTLGAPVDGVRHGVLTVTVSNTGRVDATRMWMEILLRDTGLAPEGPNWTGFIEETPGNWAASLPAALAAGRSVTLRLGLSRPASQDGATGKIAVLVRPDLKDAWQDDNKITVPIVLTG